MTPHQPRSHRPDDATLDDVIDAAMSGILAKLEAAFDSDAGLADIYSRSSATRPSRTAPTSQAAPRTGGSSRLEDACDQIDQLTAWLAELLKSARQAPFGGSSFLELARDSLVELRAGLASRTMARPEAQRLTAAIDSQLAQADQILRSRHATTLDRLASRAPGASGALTGQAQLLRQMVTRLYEPDGDDLSLQPAR